MTVGTRAAQDDESAVLAEALGWPAARLRRISREPLGDGSVAGYVLEGEPGVERVAYLDTSLLPVRAETGLAREDGVRLWEHPSDPHLPAFAATAFGHAADILFQRLGLPAVQELTLVGYRPGRRAVLRVRTTQEDYWVKVVRPSRIDRIVTTHRALAEAGVPVPAVLGWSPRGLIVMSAARGVPATESTLAPGDLLDAITDLRDAMSGARLDHPARESLGARLPWYVERLERAAASDEMGEIVRAAAAAAAPHVESRADATVTIHGDLHLGQLFLDGSAVSEVIDVDTAGVGDPADDCAAFLGHAVAMSVATTDTLVKFRLRSVVALGQARWGRDDRVRGLTTTHLLGHALAAAERGDGPRALELVRASRAAAPRSKGGLITAFDPA